MRSGLQSAGRVLRSVDGRHEALQASAVERVIDQAAALGVDMVQFIGGEPTLHPDFAELLCYAIDAGHKVEVYSKLVHVKDTWWQMFAHPACPWPPATTPIARGGTSR